MNHDLHNSTVLASHVRLTFENPLTAENAKSTAAPVKSPTKIPTNLWICVKIENIKIYKEFGSITSCTYYC